MTTKTKITAIAILATLLAAGCANNHSTTGTASWHDPKYQHLRQITKQQMLYKAQQDAITHSSGM